MTQRRQRKQILLRARRFSPGIRLSILLAIVAALVPLMPSEYAWIALDPNTIRELASLVAQVLASLVAVLMAVLLVSFELMRRSYGEYPLKSLLNNRKISELSVLFVAGIVFSILSVFFLEQDVVHSAVYVLVATLLMLAFLLLLLPSARSIALQTTSTFMINRLASSITIEDALSLGQRSRHLDWRGYLDRLQQNPVYILQQVAIRALQDRETASAQLILTELTGRLLGSLDTAPVRRDLIQAQLVFYKEVLHEAVRGNHPSIVDFTMQAYVTIHEYCAKKQAPWSDMIELNQAIGELGVRCLESRMASQAERVASGIARIVEYHLRDNVPEEERIWMLQQRAGRESKVVDYDADNHWEHVSRGHLGMLASLGEKAAEAFQGSVMSLCIISLSHFLGGVPRMALGELQKADLIEWGYFYLQQMVLKAADTDKGRVSFYFPDVMGSDIRQLHESGAAYWNRPLIRFGELIVQLAKHNRLDWHILNNLGATGRGLVEMASQHQDYADALAFVLTVFEKVKDLTEQSTSETAKKAYLDTHDQLVSIQGWTGSAKLPEPMKADLIRILSGFSEVERLRGIAGSDELRWPAGGKKT